MSQEEEIIIIGGGTKPKSGRVAEDQSDYDRARAMIDEAEANGTPIRFKGDGS